MDNVQPTLEEMTAQRDAAEADRDNLNDRVLRLEHTKRVLYAEINQTHQNTDQS